MSAPGDGKGDPRRAPALAEVLKHAAVAWQLFRQGRSLDRALDAALPEHPALRPAVQDALYTSVRHLAASERIVERLVSRAPPAEVGALLTVSLAQLQTQRMADHVVVDQAVRCANADAQMKPAAGFVNAVLRNFVRRRASLLAELHADPCVPYNAPPWWIERLRQAFPDRWIAIAQAQLQLPPLVLRVAAPTSPDYVSQLAELGVAATQVGQQAVWMHDPRPVLQIPGFAEGRVSVQDAGAQLAARWLAAQPGMRVLDACAAPGGKTVHLAELGATDITALELDTARAARIADNLRRTGRTADVVIGDAARPDAWARWPFDRILLDAPCTASGIVRRHPDIPWLRRPSDVAQLTTLQGEMLDALWPLLKVGGRLLYVVCSLFPEEGIEQIARFMQRHPEVRQLSLPASQLLPTPVGPAHAELAWHGSALPTLHDGFFYALLAKNE